MIISFQTPKNSKNKRVEDIVNSTSYCFHEAYTEKEGVIEYADSHSFDHLESWWGGELGDDSQGYRFVFKGGENDKYSENYMEQNGCSYYPERVNADNVSDFNEAYIMAYHLSSYIAIKEKLHKNSMAYKTLHIWDGGGFCFDDSLEEAKRQYYEFVKTLAEYGYEF
jgi:hypothetical protein